MASTLYTTYKEICLTQNPAVDMDTDTIKARLYSTDDYTPSAGHDFLDDVTAYSGTADATLSNKTTTDGVFDNTATITFSGVNIDGAKLVHGVVIHKDAGGAESADPLICWLEFAIAKTPNGGDIVVDWHSSGLFAI